MTGILIAFTSLAVAAQVHNRFAAPWGKAHVSRQSPNSRRRKGTAQSPGGVQAGDRRKAQREILHHQPGWQGWPSVSLRGMGTDRAEAGGSSHLQPDQEEVSEHDGLLGPGGGNGRPGAPFAAA